jgi:hypothetical protein
VIKWLQRSLAASGLWESHLRLTVSVRVTNRFEVYLVGRAPGCTQLVVKIPREVSSARLLDHEHQLLVELHALVPEVAKGLAPQSYGTIDVGHACAWVQSALPGRQVNPQFRRETFARVAEWRANLSTLTRAAPLAKADLFYEGMAPGILPSPRLELGWRLAELLEHQVPSVLAHGDLHPTNVLMSQDRIGAVDWVWASQVGRPLFDWFDFCAHLGYETVRQGGAAKRWPIVTRGLLAPGERLHTEALAGSRRIASALDIPFESIPLQLSLYACSRLHALIGHHHPQLADDLFVQSLPLLQPS